MHLGINALYLLLFTLPPRVSVQGVKSLGGHFACLCRGFEFYEVKKNVIIFFIVIWNTFTLLMIFIFKSFQKEQNSTNLLLWPPICRTKAAITPNWFNSLETIYSKRLYNFGENTRLHLRHRGHCSTFSSIDFNTFFMWWFTFHLHGNKSRGSPFLLILFKYFSIPWLK